MRLSCNIPQLLDSHALDACVLEHAVEKRLRSDELEQCSRAKLEVGSLTGSLSISTQPGHVSTFGGAI